MLNKKEVEYNTMSLVSTWLCEAKDIFDLRLVFSGANQEKIVPCVIETAGKELAKVLCNNSDKYRSAKLIGKIKNEEKIFGELDIN